VVSGVEFDTLEEKHDFIEERKRHRWYLVLLARLTPGLSIIVHLVSVPFGYCTTSFDVAYWHMQIW
jgi:hypothetical protein